MRILVNHVTRMRHPAICVAGLDLATGKHVRPIATGRLDRSLLTESGGPIELGAVVELGTTRPNPGRPQTEDHWFWPDRVTHVGTMPADRYWKTLSQRSEPTPGACFGPALIRHKWKYAVDIGTGDRSLAIMRVRSGCALDTDRYGKLTLRVPAPDKPVYVPVTDLRFYEPDQETLIDAEVDAVARAITHQDSLLMLGLARAWRAHDDEAERHWL